MCRFGTLTKEKWILINHRELETTSGRKWLEKQLGRTIQWTQPAKDEVEVILTAE